MRLDKTFSLLITALILSTVSFAQGSKKDGNINLQLTVNDSMHVVTALVTDAGAKTPLKGVEITFYLKRTFGLMKVGGGTTDTTGLVSAEFPLNIPASDASGNMRIIAKVEDNNVINDISSQSVTRSLAPFPPDKPLPREMISSRAPWWLVITFTLVVGTVWFLFAYVVYLVRRIKKAAIPKIVS